MAKWTLSRVSGPSRMSWLDNDEEWSRISMLKTMTKMIVRHQLTCLLLLCVVMGAWPFSTAISQRMLAAKHVMLMKEREGNDTTKSSSQQPEWGVWIQVQYRSSWCRSGKAWNAWWHEGPNCSPGRQEAWVSTRARWLAMKEEDWIIGKKLSLQHLVIVLYCSSIKNLQCSLLTPFEHAIFSPMHIAAILAIIEHVLHVKELATPDENKKVYR